MPPEPAMAAPTDLPAALRGNQPQPPPGLLAGLRLLRSRGMLNQSSLAQLARASWLRLRWGRRLELAPSAFVGPGVALELEYGARLAVGSWTWLGARSRIRVAAGGEVRIGDGTALGPACAIVAHRRVAIGAGCMLADGAMLTDAELESADVERPVRLQGLRTGVVELGDGVRVGPHACILPGAMVHAGVVVGPRAAVTGELAVDGAAGRPAPPAPETHDSIESNA